MWIVLDKLDDFDMEMLNPDSNPYHCNNLWAKTQILDNTAKRKNVRSDETCSIRIRNEKWRRRRWLSVIASLVAVPAVD